jgi:hypothetical protein
MKIGQVVFVDQGHPDDNFYDQIVDLEKDGDEFADYLITLRHDMQVYASQCRVLTDEEKGDGNAV